MVSSVVDAEYIKGFFDRLCHVDTSGRAIVLTTNQVDLAKTVAGTLRMMGIRCAISVGDRAKLRVSGLASLRRWDETIGFEDIGKRERLREILRSYRRPQG